MRDSHVTGRERLNHIVKAITDIEYFTEGYTKETYLDNYMLINATLFQFAIIGEAILHIDNTVLAKYTYPWHQVRGFRNFIVHEYHAIEFRIVWESIKNDLPELKISFKSYWKTSSGNSIR